MLAVPLYQMMHPPTTHQALCHVVGMTPSLAAHLVLQLSTICKDLAALRSIPTRAVITIPTTTLTTATIAVMAVATIAATTMETTQIMGRSQAAPLVGLWRQALRPSQVALPLQDVLDQLNFLQIQQALPSLQPRPRRTHLVSRVTTTRPS